MKEKKTEKRPEQHLRKAMLFRGLGLSVIGLTTAGSFLGYQSVTNWNEMEEEIENFVVVNQETVQLNAVIALPLFISLLVFLFVMRRKNKQFFSDKVSFSLFIALAITYFLYSIIEITMFTLMGALVGSLIDEGVFNRIAKKEKLLAGDQKEIDMEYAKEQRRIMARDKARNDLRGV